MNISTHNLTVGSGVTTHLTVGSDVTTHLTVGSDVTTHLTIGSGIKTLAVPRLLRVHAGTVAPTVRRRQQGSSPRLPPRAAVVVAAGPLGPLGELAVRDVLLHAGLEPDQFRADHSATTGLHQHLSCAVSAWTGGMALDRCLSQEQDTHTDDSHEGSGGDGGDDDDVDGGGGVDNGGGDGADDGDGGWL